MTGLFVFGIFGGFVVFQERSKSILQKWQVGCLKLSDNVFLLKKQTYETAKKSDR
jgi:hypothetical protein